VRNLMDQFKGGDRGDTIKEEMEEDVRTESIADTNDMRDGTPSPSQKGLKRSFEESTVRSSSISTENEKEAEPARRESKRLKKGLPSFQYDTERSHRTNCSWIKYGTTCACCQTLPNGRIDYTFTL